MKHSLQLYLASTSPRRKTLLAQIGLAFECLPVNVPENINGAESPCDYADRLALAKAKAGWNDPARELCIPVLGADTIVVCEGKILGKPTDKQDGINMLRLLSGKTHEVITSIALVKESQNVSARSISQVTFRVISDIEAETYWNTQEPCDKAGGYAVQGRGAVFIERIEGSYSGIMGLPLFETMQLLQVFQ